MAKAPYPFLWFDTNAEEAMNYYCEVFPNSRIIQIDRYPDETLDEHFKGMSGKVIQGIFEMNGQKFSCLDGGEQGFSFNNAVSFVVECENQEEIDYYWGKLSAKPEEEQCGWCTDQYGLRWQIVPTDEQKLFSTDGQIKAMMNMKKIDIQTLKNAA